MYQEFFYKNQNLTQKEYFYRKKKVKNMIYQSFEERAVELAMSYMDPLNLIFSCLALIIFSFAAYQKPELRLFIPAFGCTTLSIVLMIAGWNEGEAVSVLIAGIIAVTAILVYRKLMLNKNISTQI